MKARFVYLDGSFEVFDAVINKNGNVLTASVPKETVGDNVKYIDFLYDYFNAKIGDEGYFVTNMSTEGTFLTYFKERSESNVSRDHVFVT